MSATRDKRFRASGAVLSIVCHDIIIPSISTGLLGST